MFDCKNCGYKATHQHSLTTLMKSVHKGVRYDCNQCDYRVNWQDNLTTYIIHDGLRFDFNQCYYRTTQQHTLTTHIRSIHDGVRYDCNQCDYRPNYRYNSSIMIYNDSINRLFYLIFSPMLTFSYNVLILFIYRFLVNLTSQLVGYFLNTIILIGLLSLGNSGSKWVLNFHICVISFVCLSDHFYYLQSGLLQLITFRVFFNNSN